MEGKLNRYENRGDYVKVLYRSLNHGQRKLVSAYITASLNHDNALRVYGGHYDSTIMINELDGNKMTDADIIKLTKALDKIFEAGMKSMIKKMKSKCSKFKDR